MIAPVDKHPETFNLCNAGASHDEISSEDDRTYYDNAEVAVFPVRPPD